MSRSNRESSASKSPVELYINWNAKPGHFTYWDKEQEEDVTVKSLPMILLDERVSVTGWHDDLETSINSNLIENLTKESLKVIANKNSNNNQMKVVAEGMWADIKDSIKSAGGKYTRNIFAIVQIKEEWIIARIQLTGYALFSYGEFMKDIDKDKYDVVITMSKGSQKKKGSVKYHGIVEENRPMEGEEGNMADEAADLLDTYLDGAPKSTEENIPEPSTKIKTTTTVEVEDEDDLPF